jgi:hypothetical protein
VKFREYYKEDNKKRRERKTHSKAEVELLKKKVHDLEATKVDETTVDKLVEEKLRKLLPPQLYEGIAAWNATGQVGPIRVPSGGGSNSSFHVSPDMVTPPATIAAVQPMDLEGPMPPPVERENDRPVAARASPLAELNALTTIIS